MRTFSHTLLERSHFQPIIIFAYSGYCQLCFHLEPIWQSVVNDLEPLGEVFIHVITYFFSHSLFRFYSLSFTSGDLFIFIFFLICRKLHPLMMSEERSFFFEEHIFISRLKNSIWHETILQATALVQLMQSLMVIYWKKCGSRAYRLLLWLLKDGLFIIEAQCNVKYYVLIFFLFCHCEVSLDIALMIAFAALSAKAVRVFARDVIPNSFLLKITNHDGLRRFVDQWQSSNRVFFSHSSIVFNCNCKTGHQILFVKDKEYK